ncbi:MAG TPA: RidA family protein [Casimicrobiaceae bacterium]|nr:RidA family protein [Casimicrobiaceae bacterium]
MKSKVWYENPPGAGPAQGLYSHVGFVQGGTLAFIAGQLAVGADGSVVGRGDFRAQFRQVFANLGDVLRGLGTDYRNVVKFTTYLVHSQDIEPFMQERQALFPTLFGSEPYPPNTLLMIDRLVKEDFLIEVEAVAAVER